MQKSFVFFLLLNVVILGGCGVTPIPTETIKHSYTPNRGETISIFDGACIEEALLKAKEKFNDEPLVLVDSNVRVDTSVNRQSLMIVCEVEVQIPEAFRDET
ncbi:hypothetical protein J3L16_00780 [Alteromonas sp. 5E99-2]|uniref:hypothetical protein n=1 Tax=Alteromonas sp. 5E99-2 TaxID=2817683 RepID=UPI001A99A2BB|nr:hypothetical protein [Alteromonas sp. 5E99-2]MBO1254212.1 hypothetical protein [Alteromonas sp. 5E99-2]